MMMVEEMSVSSSGFRPKRPSALSSRSLLVALLSLGLSYAPPAAVEAFVPPISCPPRSASFFGPSISIDGLSAALHSREAMASRRPATAPGIEGEAEEESGDAGDDVADDLGGLSTPSAEDSPRRRQRRRKRQERRAAAVSAGIPVDYDSYDGDDSAVDGPSSLIDAGANAAAFNAMMGEAGGVPGEGEDLQETLSGGPSLIFAMARRMLVWDDEGYVGQNDTYRPDGRAAKQQQQQKSPPVVDAGAGAAVTATPPTKKVLPRWHPHPGISDVNPSFRKQAPVMNNAGYLGAIRRNARKRSKPSLWRYSLRVYDRMRQIEAEQASGQSKRKLRIKRTRGHHEGALVACGKLGLWREALRIYGEVVREEREAMSVLFEGDVAEDADAATKAAIRGKVQEKGLGVSDGMIMALVRACVRGSKAKTTTTTMTATTTEGKTGESSESSRNELAHKRGREPLDAARDVLLSLEEEHGLHPEPQTVNPLAAAYQSLGLRSEAAELLRMALPDRPKIVQTGRRKKKKRKPRPQSAANKSMSDSGVLLDTEDIAETEDNAPPVATKDRASYSLLVGGAVAEEDWQGAVEALRDMTESGLYPTGRSLNAWSEASEGSRAGRGVGRRKNGSWRRRRDEYWLESLR